MGLEFYNIFYWVKIIHIAFVVAWMAGLLYLPRLYVYHQENFSNKSLTKVFKVMEYRLYYYIMNPAMIVVWISGYYLGYILGFDIWLQIKIGFVIAMTFYHFLLRKHLNLFASDKQHYSSKYYRIINEIPFLILFIILILVVIKPFY